MDSSNLDPPPFFEIYAEYREIASNTQNGNSKEQTVTLFKSLETAFYTNDMLFSDLDKLMSRLDFSVDSHQFSCFYNFVFFICREKGQKNITVDRAISAWRLVLAGRFRLLNEWCAFVEKNQRYNVSEDTWQQLLAFSRCVNEDLEGYDPKGAWPVLIDDFVEHMYRTGHPDSCSSRDASCNCGDTEIQSSISNTFRGLKLLPGSKRKSMSTCKGKEETSYVDVSTTSMYFSKSKRSRETSILDVNINANVAYNHVDINAKNSFGCTNNSACAVEDSLSKGFEGNLSTGCSFRYVKKSKV